MAVSMQWKLLAAAAALSALAFGACGDDKSEPSDNGNKDAGSGGPSDAGGGIGNNIISDLDDGVSGKACSAVADCGGKNTRCDIGTGQTEGTCSGTCQNDGQCGAGGKCISVTVLGQTIGSCQKPCSGASECSSGQECRAGADVEGAIGRLTDGGIGIDASVDMSSTCQTIPKTMQLAADIAGKACTADTACGAGRCMTEYKFTVFGVTLFTQPFPAGYCTGYCTENAQCGAGAGCFGGSAANGVTGNCLKTCTAHTDCRTEYACNSFGRPGMTNASDPKYCIPGERTSPEAGVPDGGAADAAAADASADAAADATPP